MLHRDEYIVRRLEPADAGFDRNVAIRHGTRNLNGDLI
jgi:hypothetical protein